MKTTRGFIVNIYFQISIKFIQKLRVMLVNMYVCFKSNFYWMKPQPCVCVFLFVVVASYHHRRVCRGWQWIRSHTHTDRIPLCSDTRHGGNRALVHPYTHQHLGGQRQKSTERCLCVFIHPSSTTHTVWHLNVKILDQKHVWWWEDVTLLQCSPLQLVPLICRYPWGQVQV